jgi:hypothetical protein
MTLRTATDGAVGSWQAFSAMANPFLQPSLYPEHGSVPKKLTRHLVCNEAICKSLRGSPETRHAIQRDFVRPCTCLYCRVELHCILDVV